MTRSLPFDYDNLSDAFEAIEDMNQNIPPSYVRTIHDEPPVEQEGEHQFMDADARATLCERLERNAANRSTPGHRVREVPGTKAA